MRSVTATSSIIVSVNGQSLTLTRAEALDLIRVLQEVTGTQQPVLPAPWPPQKWPQHNPLEVTCDWK